MKNEHFHLVMRYSYWNELCVPDKNPPYTGGFF